MTIDESAGSREEVVQELANVLRSNHMKKVLSLWRARVPIVKFNDPHSGISCDICINNVLALYNTKLLADYAKIDLRVKQLGYILKYWAKRRAINEPYQGTLSSYALLLMLINFLQLRNPPILPCLQQMKDENEPNLEQIICGFDCSYYTKTEKLQGFGQPNKETLGDLLAAFFRFYAHEFDYKNSVISVRTGGLLTKAEKQWVKPQNKDNCWFTLEDPLEVSHNLGRVVDRHTLRTIRFEFMRAYRVLVQTGDLYQICQEFREDELSSQERVKAV